MGGGFFLLPRIYLYNKRIPTFIDYCFDGREESYILTSSMEKLNLFYQGKSFPFFSLFHNENVKIGYTTKQHNSWLQEKSQQIFSFVVSSRPTNAQ